MRIGIVVLFCVYAFGATLFIDFTGNRSFSKEQLYEELGFEPSLWQRLFHTSFMPKVDTKLLPTLQEELLLFYQEQGFLDAKVDVLIHKDRATFQIQENTPITIAAISATSNFPLHIPFKKGERFIASKFIDFKKRVQKELLRAGYCSFEFNPKAYIFHKSHKVYISIYLDKGSICHIGKIAIKGLETLPNKVVLTHLYVKPGDEFNLTKIEESYKRLYSLEYFDILRFDYSKKVQNSVILQIFAKERRKRHRYRVGLGYETEQGVVASLAYRNLNYHTHQLNLLLRYAKFRRKAALKLFTPSVEVFGYAMDMRDEIGYSYDKFESFTSQSYYMKHTFLLDRYDRGYKFGITAQKYKISTTSSCIASGKYTLLYPFIELLFDRRDSKLFPKSGYYILASAEASLHALAKSNYIKAATEIGLFYPLGQEVLFAKAYFGLIAAGNTLPPSKLFIAGGLDTNRAYAYRSIYALDSSCKIGGKSLLATTLEYRFPFKNFYGAIFWDHTSVARNYSLTHAVDGVGFGGLYPSPIGTVRIYFGFDPSDLSQNQLSLSIGATF